MTRLALLVTALAFVAPAHAAEERAKDPMAGWKPPKVTREKEGRKELTAFFHRMEQASKKGDIEAAAALVDFPVLMVTDDSKGEAMGGPWTREQWVEVMKPFYDKPDPSMKVTHRPTMFFVTDSIATVDDQWTATMGGRKMNGRSAMLLIHKGGEWKVKSMAEGGWGDMPMPGEQASGPAGGEGGQQPSAGAQQPSEGAQQPSEGAQQPSK